MSKFRLIFVVSFALFFASSAYAADIAVDADCSLADAIIAANRDRAEGNCPAGRGADTIILNQDITLRTELPVITSDITIEGNGYTISGNHRYRIFYNDGGDLTINDLTMTKGYVEGDLILNRADASHKNTTTNPFGGAIVNWQGVLTISGSSFSDNLAEYYGGAIYNSGRVSISDSAFSHNSADGSGGAIANGGELSISDSVFSHNSADDGGAIYNSNRTTLSIVNSAFSHNSADDGGAIDNWKGTLSIVNSAFSHNSADDNGGAIDNSQGTLTISGSTFRDNLAFWGGAINNDNFGELSISGSTFSVNSAYSGGAIHNREELSIANSTFSVNSAGETGGAIHNRDDVRISNSTFSDNSADETGDAIFNREDGKLRITNSIIAGRGWRACYSDSRLRHNINNFIQDGTCSPAFSGDPKLGKLVEPEDGSPAYFPLLAGSPAIDAADVDDYCPATDQIGTVRPQGAGCDIGAIEYVAP